MYSLFILSVLCRFCMAELSSKKPVRRPVRKAANSPVPPPLSSGPTCGHDGCGTACSVRYVGPTSHMRDHHIVHTARGISQVWTAAIVAGLAVVLTGAVAWSAVDAQQKTTTDPGLAAVRTSVDMLGKRMDRMEDLLKQLVSQCKASSATCSPADGTTGAPKDPQACYQSCVEGGAKTKAECRKACGVPEPATTTTAPSTAPVSDCAKACANDAAACKKQLAATASAEKCGDLYNVCISQCK